MDIQRLCVESTFIILVFLIEQTLVAWVDDDYDDYDEATGHWNRCPSIRHKLRNGRVKIEARGRLAMFLCYPGYELAGKEYTLCLGGHWIYPLPVCVSRGCHRPPHVYNARVTMMYRGAVLTYECLQGYTLEGGASIYCELIRWSADTPTCVDTIDDMG